MPSRAESAQHFRVWKTDLEQPIGWIENAAAAILTADERERGPREIRDVWLRRLAARAALRIALAQTLGRPPGSLAFERGPNGKPSLVRGSDGDEELHFNTSRSDGLCLIAITTLGPVGVDVERVIAFPELEGIARSRFAPREAAAILGHSGARRVRAFYDCWTRKEALLKASGAGLTAGLGGVEVTFDGGPPAVVAAGPEGGSGAWSLAAVRTDRSFAGAVALRSTGARLDATVEPSLLSLTPDSLGLMQSGAA